MKITTEKWLARVALLMVLAWFAPQQPIAADEPPTTTADASVFEEALQQNQAGQSVRYQEHRVGGRLERVTITRENGFTEIYQNNRADTVWSAEENEIGEVPNMRQWVIGTW